MTSETGLRAGAGAPMLTRHAVDRQPGQEIPGRYCAVRRMWVVDLSTGAEPLIEVSGALAELTTKTKVEQESDDTTDVSDLQLVTKTDVQQERDDESRWAGGHLALETKTEVNTEQDKQDPEAAGMALLELDTKTAIRVEQDRQDRDAFSVGLLELATKTLTSTEQDDQDPPYQASAGPLAARLRH